MTRPAPVPRRLRVAVVDADHRVRDSLAELLELSDDLEVVGRAGQVRDALDVCADGRPDVVVIDPRLPDAEAGLALIADLRARAPRTVVLVLTWPGTTAQHAALGAVADGFVEKTAAPHELARRIVELATPVLASRSRRRADAGGARTNAAPGATGGGC